MSRTGGDLVVESLTALGARTVFGLPGQHALGLFDALHRSSLRYVGSRTEVNAAFAADGHARTTGEVTPLFVSTGPGALQSLAGLQEAAASSVPILGISSQIPSAGLGGARRGFLHELPDQQASFRDVVKHTRVVRAASQIPSAIAEAWRIAASAPTGPVWVEIPQDVLLGPAGVPAVSELRADPIVLEIRSELIVEAARARRSAAAGHPGGRRSAPQRRAGGVADFGGENRRAGRHHVRRQRCVPLAPQVVAAVLAGGLAHHRSAPGRRRSCGDRFRPWRAVEQLSHLPTGRSGHSDRSGSGQTRIQPFGAGHSCRRERRAARTDTARRATGRGRSRTVGKSAATAGRSKFDGRTRHSRQRPRSVA